MKHPCPKCSGSGIYIDYAGSSTYYDSSGVHHPAHNPVKCKRCNGTGWEDKDEMVSVPRKYIKDEYWRRV